MKVIGTSSGGGIIIELNLSDAKRMRELGLAMAQIPETPTPALIHECGTAMVVDEIGAVPVVTPVSSLPTVHRRQPTVHSTAGVCKTCGAPGSRECWSCRKKRVAAAAKGNERNGREVSTHSCRKCHKPITGQAKLCDCCKAVASGEATPVPVKKAAAPTFASRPCFTCGKDYTPTGPASKMCKPCSSASEKVSKQISKTGPITPERRLQMIRELAEKMGLRGTSGEQSDD